MVDFVRLVHVRSFIAEQPIERGLEVVSSQFFRIFAVDVATVQIVAGNLLEVWPAASLCDQDDYLGLICELCSIAV